MADGCQFHSKTNHECQNAKIVLLNVYKSFVRLCQNCQNWLWHVEAAISARMP